MRVLRIAILIAAVGVAAIATTPTPASAGADKVVSSTSITCFIWAMAPPPSYIKLANSGVLNVFESGTVALRCHGTLDVAPAVTEVFSSPEDFYSGCNVVYGVTYRYYQRFRSNGNTELVCKLPPGSANINATADVGAVVE
jgi:hypothetical protein